MLLAIDVGNTNICFAIYDGDDKTQQWRVETEAFPSFTFEEGLSVSDIIVCSVVPNINESLIALCQKTFNITPDFVTHDNIDIDIQIDVAKQLGTDRLVGASAAVSHYKTPAIIVDLGTATTFDVVDAGGAHKGGVIAPGIRLSLAALEQAAAQLPDIKIEKPDKVIGTNTKDAMQSGIYWGYIGLIEGTIARITEEIGDKPFIIATGGLSPLFASGTDVFDVIDQDLIMKGLVHMHKVIRNQGLPINAKEA